ncbi:hypothetical protein NLU13_0964 [Sarocladium strictum]|uniref:NAD(P)-binding domain-containing protein n=1 Tax=Sarocladium strictum TaxID=5046 RepID=A0AA39GQ20_SARSR|nr:hypothetical protein NLU13_0964 [Sarocladium strictum]
MSHHVLLLGGHGKIALYLTPLLLRRSWTVTSVVRNPDHRAEILRLGEGQPGKLNVLVRSIEDVTSEEKAKAVLDEVKPDYVAWSAGAGGKGGAERTFKVDRDACIHYINAAAAHPSVSRFLLVSYLGSRRSAAPWWSSPSEWDSFHKEVNFGVLANYYQAKIASDEALYRKSRESTDFVGICLRPGTLTEENDGGIEVGKTKAVKGSVGREKVAKVADELLAAEGVRNSWIDLYDGDEDIHKGVQRVVSEGIDAAEGEPVTQQ